MTLRPDGSRRCDRCGNDVGNGGIDKAAKVSDLLVRPDGTTAVVTYDLCRAPRDGAPNGCAAHVLSPSALDDYLTHTGGSNAAPPAARTRRTRRA